MPASFARATFSYCIFAKTTSTGVKSTGVVMSGYEGVEDGTCGGVADESEGSSNAYGVAGVKIAGDLADAAASVA